MTDNTAAIIALEEVQERLARSKKAAELAGNPLRINGPKPELSQATKRKIERQEMVAAGNKAIPIRAPDGSTREVWQRPNSFRSMGFQDHQIHAAERFARDWECARRGLRGQSFEMGVDGGGVRGGGELARINAQTRLDACRAHLGARSWEVVVGVVINGATVRNMKTAASTHDRNIRQDITNAFNELDGFYTGSRRKDKTWEAYEAFNQKMAALIAEAEREVG